MENENAKDESKTLTLRLSESEYQQLQKIQIYLAGLLGESVGDLGSEPHEFPVRLSPGDYQALLESKTYLEKELGHEVTLEEILRLCLHAAPLTPGLLPILRNVLKEDVESQEAS